MTHAMMERWWRSKQVEPEDVYEEDDPTVEWSLEEAVILLRKCLRVFKVLTGKKVSLKAKVNGMLKLAKSIQEFLDQMEQEGSEV